MNDEEFIRRKCGAKKRFLSKEQALNARNALQTIARNRVGTYQCPYCHYWHVGRIRNTDITPTETHRKRLNLKMKSEQKIRARLSRRTCLTIPNKKQDQE